MDVNLTNTCDSFHMGLNRLNPIETTNRLKHNAAIAIGFANPTKSKKPEIISIHELLMAKGLSIDSFMEPFAMPVFRVWTSRLTPTLKILS